jgi:predicted ArsR family transcriptional regulator
MPNASTTSRLAAFSPADAAAGAMPSPDAVRSVDSQLLRALGDGKTRGVGELIATLGVTATAVRQRLERLLESGLIERAKVASGRGRPAFEYRLTERGRWCAGADPAELAEAMWQEILELADEDVRLRILTGIARRLGQGLASEATAAVEQASQGVNVPAPTAPRRRHQRLSPGVIATTNSGLAERMRIIGDSLAKRRIATRISFHPENQLGLPVLDLPSCPYPALRDATHDRSMCELERRMLSEALGGPVQLSSCVLDGDSVCRFTPGAVGVAESPRLDEASG